jgi:hypothetical protein
MPVRESLRSFSERHDPGFWVTDELPPTLKPVLIGVDGDTQIIMGAALMVRDGDIVHVL